MRLSRSLRQRSITKRATGCYLQLRARWRVQSRRDRTFDGMLSDPSPATESTCGKIEDMVHPFVILCGNMSGAKRTPLWSFARSIHVPRLFVNQTSTSSVSGTLEQESIDEPRRASRYKATPPVYSAHALTRYYLAHGQSITARRSCACESMLPPPSAQHDFSFAVSGRYTHR